MSDDDPFADLGETLTDDSADDEPSTGEQSGAPTNQESPAREPVDQRDPVTDSAFSYEEAKQRPVYAREGTIEEFDSWLKFELERELDQRGYQNIVIREMTDALLRTVVEEDLVSEVAERFEEARESAPGKERE